MSYYTGLEAAKTMPGMRLVTTAGVPGPWGEAAKGIMHVKKIPVVRIAQQGAQENPELVAWTGINNAPIAIWENERPRSGWVEIIMLAERIQPEPPLIPRNERDRAMMFGITHELCSEDGYGWNRRLTFFAGWEASLRDDAGMLGRESFDRMRGKYDPGTKIAHIRQRLIDVLSLLSSQLLEQKSRGSRYYIGEALTALDIYGACFAAQIKPLPIELCPTSPEMHAGYAERDPEILRAADPIILEHRDYIYQNYLELPMQF